MNEDSNDWSSTNPRVRKLMRVPLSQLPGVNVSSQNGSLPYHLENRLKKPKTLEFKGDKGQEKIPNPSSESEAKHRLFTRTEMSSWGWPVSIT